MKNAFIYFDWTPLNSIAYLLNSCTNMSFRSKFERVFDVNHNFKEKDNELFELLIHSFKTGNIWNSHVGGRFQWKCHSLSKEYVDIV